jgi:hypothetical protein
MELNCSYFLIDAVHIPHCLGEVERWIPSSADVCQALLHTTVLSVKREEILTNTTKQAEVDVWYKQSW